MIPSSSKMGYHLKFNQRWEFRRGDSEFDSSSNESESSSNDEPVLKKHKLVSSLISLEKDEISDGSKGQQKGKFDAGTRSHFKFGKTNNRQIGLSKKDDAVHNAMGNDYFRANGKKSKDGAYESAALDDFKIFMESLLEELKVARENLLIQMREEMHKLMADDTTQLPTRRDVKNKQEVVQVQHHNKFESCLKARNCNGQSSERSVKSTRPADSNNLYKAHENQVEHGQDIRPLSSTRKESSYGQEVIQVQHQNSLDLGMKAQSRDGGSLERSVKSEKAADYANCTEVLEDQVDHNQTIGPITSTEKDRGKKWGSSFKPDFSSNSSDQMASSMYLTLPTVLSQPHVENHMLDFSGNYIQPAVTGNKRSMTVERANIMLEASTRSRYFSGIQQDEKIGSSTQISSRNMDCFDRNSTPTSSIGNGFPVPLHQGLDGGFNVLSQVSLENLSRETNSVLGLRMNGGAIRFSGGNHVLSERYVANNFHSHLKYKADGGLMAFQTSDLKDGHLFPK